MNLLLPWPATKQLRLIPRPLFLACLGAVSIYFLLFHRLGDRDLTSSHEARAAQNAYTIRTGWADWRMPRLFDGRDELQKPPLYYWLVVLASMIRGQVDAGAVRLPSALAALLGAAMLGGMLWRRGRPLAACLSMLILLTCLRYTWLARVGRIDMPLTAAVTLMLVAYWLAQGGLGSGCRGLLVLVGGYLAAAAALLLKGPIGLVLAAGVMACHGAGLVVWRTRLPCGAATAVRSLLWGVPLVAALTLPWFWWATLATRGAFAESFFWKHTLQRGLGGDEQLDGHEHPWWFYLVQIGMDAAPWSLLAPWIIWWAARHGMRDPEARFGLVWFLAMLAFLSLMRYKRPDYLLPAFPGLALALGCGLEQFLLTCSSRSRQLWLGALLGLGLSVTLGWLMFVELVVPRLEPTRALAPFARAVRARAPDLVLLFRIDSHCLNWHLGWGTQRLWEWENLEIWLARPERLWVIMPPECFAEAARQLSKPLHIIDRTLAEHATPLVLASNQPDSPDAFPGSSGPSRTSGQTWLQSPE